MKAAACAVSFLWLCIAATAVMHDKLHPPADRDPSEAEPVALEAPTRRLTGTKPLPYQHDPTITRPALVGKHYKWLQCSGAFWDLGEGQCEKKQKFVPPGYWFETGRRVPKGTDCGALTGDGDVPTAICSFKKGLKMVLPVINYLWFACDNFSGALEDPRLGPQALQYLLPNLRIVKATVDGKDIDPLDALNVITQDGDGDYTYPTARDKCVNHSEQKINLYGGCPLYAAGPYVFIDTSTLALGTHELILIGEDTSDGGCSAVKHIFTLYE